MINDENEVKLRELLEYCHDKGLDCQGEIAWSGYVDVARRLREILDREAGQ